MAENENQTGEEVEEVPHGGNIGLPFGLCKKYGIAIGDNWTPRDAWNALARRGIYPPWTKEGKNQYVTKEEDKKDDRKIVIEERQKKVYDNIRSVIDKNKKFSNEYKDRLNEAVKSLSDEEIEIFAETFNDKNVSIENGSGQYSPWGRSIRTPNAGKSSIDKELGYEFGATTFFHEYGHYLDDMAGQFTKSDEYVKTVNDDCLNFINDCRKKIGEKELPNLDKLGRATIVAIGKFYERETEHTPRPTYEQDERERHIPMPWRSSYSSDQEYYNAIEEYNRKMVEQRKFLQSEEFDQRKKQFKAKADEWDSKYKAKDVVRQRLGFIGDMVGGATGGRINPYSFSKTFGTGMDQYGHTDRYWKGSTSYGIKLAGTPASVEVWAEYTSFKMTKDKKGLELFKKYMPKTYGLFEKKYKTLLEDIKNGSKYKQ